MSDVVTLTERFATCEYESVKLIAHTPGAIPVIVYDPACGAMEAIPLHDAAATANVPV